MSNWKIKRSRKAGIIPNVGQFPDSETVIWNQADGKLWGLRIIEGNKTVVLIGGGVNTIGETHTRLHALDSALDHAPNPDNAGRIIIYDSPEGKVIAADLVSFKPEGSEAKVSITKDYVAKMVVLDVNEGAISHNNLKDLNVGDYQHITTSEKENLHVRQHIVLDANDHAPDPNNAGRVIMFDAPDGNLVAMDIASSTPDSLSVDIDYTGKQIVLALDESGIDHNLLKNFCEFRHKRMEYSPALKAYLIEP